MQTHRGRGERPGHLDRSTVGTNKLRRCGLSRRIPLATIDREVSARLGQTRAQGNAQPTVEHDADRQVLQRAGSFDSLRRAEASGNASRKCPDVDGLVPSLTTEIEAARPYEAARTGAPTRTPTGAKDFRFNDAFQRGHHLLGWRMRRISAVTYVRMEAKRRALDEIAVSQRAADE